LGRAWKRRVMNRENGDDEDVLISLARNHREARRDSRSEW